MKHIALALLTVAFGTALADEVGMGHSRHGAAFDAGLRLRPWKMEGVGTAPFPISTKNPEVQAWYDQGNALLHSFWFEEAERAFRWCHKLEPENAMAYLGMARCGLTWFTISSPGGEGLKRYRDFLVEAVKRKEGLPERERMYIEAWEASCLGANEPGKVIVEKLSAICIKYPQDMEAKALLGLFNIGLGSPVANDSLLKEVLRANPMHPGAHHARIHNWDGWNSEEAIASCELYGKAAPGVGHSLHMPGHIYSKVGMWHEAAIAMDSATRVELRYMNDRFALPYETWNYQHNRDYLCYIQEQLGRAEDSLRGARDLVNAPQDPDVNPGETWWTQLPLMRALVKFERWDEILDPKTWRTSSSTDFELFRSAAEALALVSKGDKTGAREKLRGVRESMAKMLAEETARDPSRAEQLKAEFEQRQPALIRVAEARLKMLEGDRLGGLSILMGAAEDELKTREKRAYPNDPAMDAWPLTRILGDAFAERGDHRAAIDAYEKGLAQEPNDGWCLAGLAKSWSALGEREKARGFAGQMMAVWSGADKGIRAMDEVAALDLGARPTPKTLRPERTYVPSDLDKLGPSNWRPFPAPRLEGLDPEGRPVRLEEFRGKNVLLVFYLSDQCVHCIEQLAAINGRMAEFEANDTVVLACSGDAPEKNKMNQLASFQIKLVSDTGHDNARRFSSYDDFEDIELHSTILIDKDGRVRWKRTGGDPFTKLDYLLAEIKRW
ncbi:MAG: redoxin domain-containing protein [Fimbriimonadaceae bacterium]|nr:redoxin domain-containing protein [Fimbriimonadaceae bacterium]QYK55870.1 MAG: redoxin domain-containing protein [Fimbriimonadaceae bacterium]